jgi:hypothetical protein
MSGYPPEPDPFSRDGARPGDGLGSDPNLEPPAYASKDEAAFPTYPNPETGPSNYANPDPVEPDRGQGVQPSSGYPPSAIQGQPYGAFGAPPPRRSPYAIPSLILGIIGTVSVCGITGPAAVGLGIAALKQINTLPETYTGRRMAVAGIVTGAIGSLWMLFWLAIAFSG